MLKRSAEPLLHSVLQKKAKMAKKASVVSDNAPRTISAAKQPTHRKSARGVQVVDSDGASGGANVAVVDLRSMAPNEHNPLSQVLFSYSTPKHMNYSYINDLKSHSYPYYIFEI